MNGNMLTLLTISTLVVVKNLTSPIGSGNLKPVPDKMAEQFISYSVMGPEYFDSRTSDLISFGMKKYDIIDMTEFRGMEDPNQIISEFLSLLYDVSEEDRVRTFALARNLIRLGFFDPKMYFPISSVVYNFSEDKYDELLSMFSNTGYFIVNKRTIF